MNAHPQSGADVNDWRTNVVVVGSGVAGLSTALALAPTPVTVITKTPTAASGSSIWAQGGIAAAIGADDTPEDHGVDTIAAGAGLVDAERAHLLAREGAAAVRRLIDDGVPFDRKADGTISLGREAAHGCKRIVHSGGDATGRNLIAALLKKVEATPSIRLLPECFVADLRITRGRVSGVVALSRRLGWLQLHANAVVLASGGIGALWQETTNPAEATGDGMALAARVGARLGDMEFVQFHPTALAPANGGDGSRLALLTEALRGAGAHLLDADGRRFMLDEHPMAELAPRDVVARAIAHQAISGRVFLDMRPALAAEGEKAFPQALTLCANAGYDPRIAPVPVTPAAHYAMGGVVTDTFGRTDVDGLWACGEVANTGVHGGNRLASNSLLEGLVFGERVADDIRRHHHHGYSGTEPAAVTAAYRVDPAALADIRAGLRATMGRYVGLVRDADGLATANRRLAELNQRFEALDTERPSANDDGGEPRFEDVVAWGEVRNMLNIARLVTVAAARRCESRGAHFRSDYPAADDGWALRQMLTLDDLRLDLSEDALQAATTAS